MRQPPNPRQTRFWFFADSADLEAIREYCKREKIPIARFSRKAMRELAVRLGIVEPRT
jgi:hypothetical protein